MPTAEDSAGVMRNVAAAVVSAILVAPAGACDLNDTEKLAAQMIESEEAQPFHHGVAESFMSPQDQAAGNTEWRFEITRSVVLHPNAATTVRLIDIMGDHVGGTGSRGYVAAFRCDGTEPKQVLSVTREGAGSIVASRRAIEVVAPEWRAKDAHCCPSREQYQVYRWDEAVSQFVLQRQWLTLRHP